MDSTDNNYHYFLNDNVEFSDGFCLRDDLFKQLDIKLQKDQQLINLGMDQIDKETFPLEQVRLNQQYYQKLIKRKNTTTSLKQLTEYKMTPNLKASSKEQSMHRFINQADESVEPFQYDDHQSFMEQTNRNQPMDSVRKK